MAKTQQDAPYAEIALTTASQSLAVKQNSPDVVVEVAVPISVEKASNAKPEAPGIWMLVYCCLGIMISISLNTLVLEQLTTHRVLGEMSLIFAFSAFYSVAALGLRFMHKEKRSTMPQSSLVIVGALAFGSTVASIVALRYVTFIARILGKSCKSIPVMVIGLCFGKRYALKKYLSVLVLCSGVALFLIGSNHDKHKHAPEATAATEAVTESVDHASNMLLGSCLLVLSLLFDGATGALEDRLLEKYHIGAFDLMFAVNFWKSVFAVIGMAVAGEMSSFVQMAVPAIPSLLLLGATGSLGQAFIFFTISKFGALTTAIIGTCRKVISIVLSVIFFGHVLASPQVAGLAVAFVGISMNWLKGAACSRKPGQRIEVIKPQEANELLDTNDGGTLDSEDDTSDELSPTMQDDDDLAVNSSEVQRGLKLVNAWQSETDVTIEEGRGNAYNVQVAL